MHVLQRFVVKPETISTAGVLVILLTSGLSTHVEISPLLSCLFLGIVQTNLTPEREKLVDALFSNFEPAILAIFFTLAGMELDLGLARLAGRRRRGLLRSRAAGKLVSVRIAMTLSRRNGEGAQVPGHGAAAAGRPRHRPRAHRAGRPAPGRPPRRCCASCWRSC